ncbi:uroporphyrinogen-III synthase [Marinobacter sp.]|uniref:uroporphyrinogen-III synthase n=1 Tax=Marinobacter sp. TaxID=50741 RepID=UPI0034A5AC06
MATPLPDHKLLVARRILICRPEPEASRLADAFREAGAEARVLPLIRREPLPETPATRTLIQNLDLYTHVIAVSPYAAGLFLALADNWWPQLPMGIRWYGVGGGTASIFAQSGLDPCKPAKGWTSEALLALPSLQTFHHEKVLLVRGEDGRELIQQTLTERGADVTLLPLYRRLSPTPDKASLDSALLHFHPDAVITLSGETLNNFIALSKNSGHNPETTLLVVPASRIAQRAHQVGLTQTCVPQSLADTDIVAAVAQELDRRTGSAGNTK